MKLPDIIVDSHVHLWDPSRLRYTWLDGLPQLNRAFISADFAAASAPVGVGKIIFVECGCEPSQSLDEVDWISALAQAEPRLRGIVAHAPLEKGETLRADLETLASHSLVKGVRRLLQGEADVDFCLRPEFVAGVGLLGKFGFTLDLCIRHEQLRAVTKLVRLAPEVTFVLDHFGKPDVRGKRFEPWAGQLKQLAALPNVVAKISGLATEADWHNWQPADLAPYLRHIFVSFGPKRVMFGSDWPVMTLATHYQQWVEIVLGLIPFAGDEEKKQFFQTNAERIYHV